MKSLWIARITTWFFAVLESNEGCIAIRIGLVVGDLVGGRLDPRPPSGATDA